MTPKLNPVEQLIAARVSFRFASVTKEADLVDINDYQKAIRSLKGADSVLAGLKTSTSRYDSVAKHALNEFATTVDSLPSELEKLGVSTKGIKRFHTQLVNLIKVAKSGQPLRAYSTFSSDRPLSKAKSVIMSRKGSSKVIWSRN